MPDLTPELVIQLAESMGLDMDERRARTIASRLAGIIDELNEIPDELLNSVEPAHRFSVEESDR